MTERTFLRIIGVVGTSVLSGHGQQKMGSFVVGIDGVESGKFMSWRYKVMWSLK